MASHGNNPIWDSWSIWSILVHLGLLNPGIQIIRKGRGKNSKTGNQTGNGAGTVKKPKCTLCVGKHWTLMFCPKLS